MFQKKTYNRTTKLLTTVDDDDDENPKYNCNESTNIPKIGNTTNRSLTTGYW